MVNKINKNVKISKLFLISIYRTIIPDHKKIIVTIYLMFTLPDRYKGNKPSLPLLYSESAYYY